MKEIDKDMISGVCEIIIAGLSVVIACLQLKLSKQINMQNLSREKGYFIIEETNLRKKEDFDYEKVKGLFDLKKPLHFRLYGNGDVFLLKEQVVINGVIVETREPLETFFSIYEQHSPYGILLPLKESDNAKVRLDIEITLRLKNVIGNIYTEKVLLIFVRENLQEKWRLQKKNTSFGFK